jgi:hypothetical protein
MLLNGTAQIEETATQFPQFATATQPQFPRTVISLSGIHVTEWNSANWGNSNAVSSICNHHATVISENCYQPEWNTCYWMEQRKLRRANGYRNMQLTTCVMWHGVSKTVVPLPTGEPNQRPHEAPFSGFRLITSFCEHYLYLYSYFGFYVARRFISTFAKSRRWSVSWAR